MFLKFEERIHIHEDELSDLEIEIAEYILNHKKEVSEIKIIVLAEKFFTVPNTISRLCHKLDYSGFLDLKESLKELNLTSDKKKDTLKEVLLKNFDLIDESKNKKVALLIKKASLVVVFGIGATGDAAKIIIENFNAVEYKFLFCEYDHEVLRRIEEAGNTLFLFVSLSGQNELTLFLSEKVKKSGKKLITLTELKENPLAKMADIALFCYSPDKNINNWNIIDKTPLFIIMDDILNQWIKINKIPLDP